MLQKIILLINILTWSVIAGQSYMYIIALANVSKALDAPSYIQFRQLTDQNFMAKYKWVVYKAMVMTPLLCIVTASQAGIVFICSLVTLVMLILDLVFTVRGNLPINKLINTWTMDNYPADWEQVRAKWLSVYAKRQVVTIAGFISLVVAAVFGT